MIPHSPFPEGPPSVKYLNKNPVSASAYKSTQYQIRSKVKNTYTYKYLGTDYEPFYPKLLD